MISTIKSAKLLGWTSMAVGITEIAATRWVEREIGTDGHETLIRSFGMREIAAGITILAQPGLNGNLAAALWGRVAGDAMDLAALGAAAHSTRNPKGLTSITSVVLAITGLDILVASLTQRDLYRARDISVRARQRVTPANAIPIPARAGSDLEPASKHSDGAVTP